MRCIESVFRSPVRFDRNEFSNQPQLRDSQVPSQPTKDRR
jgi:hypothetical protein